MGRSNAAPLQRKAKKIQSRDPIHPAATHLPATNPPSCATALKPPPPRRASLANKLSPAARLVAPHPQPAPPHSRRAAGKLPTPHDALQRSRPRLNSTHPDDTL